MVFVERSRAADSSRREHARHHSAIDDARARGVCPDHVFALAALLLATLAIYGIVSYFVRHRRAEIGTRMALGATSRNVLSLIVGGGVAMAALGVLVGGVLGLGAALYLVRVFEIEKIGPVPFVSATAIVGVVALAASAVPAWRASRLSPTVAIRD